MKTRTKTNRTFARAFFGLATLMLLLFGFKASAQRTINSTGGTGTISGDTYSYSIGEMVLVSTAATANNYFTQGVLQNDDVNLEIHDSQYLSEGLELYPNPVANTVYLQPSFQGGGELSMQLYDLRGRLIITQEAKLQTGTEKQSLDLSLLQEGTYLLQAVLKEGERVYRHSFKIIKFSEQ